MKRLDLGNIAVSGSLYYSGRLKSLQEVQLDVTTRGGDRGRYLFPVCDSHGGSRSITVHAAKAFWSTAALLA